MTPPRVQAGAAYPPLPPYLAPVPTYLFGQLKWGHEQLIAEAPIQLTLRRQTRARTGSHYSDWRDDPPEGLGPYTSRVFLNGTGSSQRGPREIGNNVRDPSWGLALPAEAQLKGSDGEDQNVRLEFEHPVHGRFKLVRVRPLAWQDQVFGWNCDIEAVR